MAVKQSFRTLDDLERTVRALATEFKTDKVFIIRSQAILLSWPGAPTAMRSSLEIDAYPGNAKFWEIEERKKEPDAEASEHINALFGQGSMFHQTHGFYIDGVDDNTARLPPNWEARAFRKRIEVAGKSVLAVAPAPEDLIVSKLARLDPKDKEFVESYIDARPLDLKAIEELVLATDLDPAVADRAITYLRSLARREDVAATKPERKAD
jgi:hypothetical protein